MNIPIIDSSTLTEEQREEVRSVYNDAKKFTYNETIAIINDSYIDVLEWLFGKEFFEKEE